MILKVLQWNCMYSEDIEAVADFVKQSGADIVFLQELTNKFHATHSDTGAFVAERLGFDSFVAYGPMTLPDGHPAHMGVGIFSKFPLINKERVILQAGSEGAGKIITDERLFLQANIVVGSTTIGLGTTHLPFHPTFRTTPQKQQMVETISGYASKHSNYLFGADLNTTPFTSGARTLRQHGLSNAGPALKHPSWTTKPFSIGSWQYEQLQWRLDYILTKGSLKPCSAHILGTELSDHLPIAVELEITE